MSVSTPLAGHEDRCSPSAQNGGEGIWQCERDGTKGGLRAAQLRIETNLDISPTFRRSMKQKQTETIFQSDL